MIRLLLIGLLFFLIACNSNSKKFNDFENDFEAISSSFKQLEGKWTGTFQKLNPTYDTIYYEDLKEKLEYKLSGTISDSSLVKSIIIVDTFEMIPIALNIFKVDSIKLTAEAKISSEFFKCHIPVSVDVSQNLRVLKTIHFGEIQSLAKSQDSLVTNINFYQHESLQQALSSHGFDLEVKKQNKNSLVLGLSEGYGLIKLGRL